MRVIILEDEKLALDRLKRMLIELRPEIEILAELSTLHEATEFFSRNKTTKEDLLFFDIQLSDGVSFELFDQFIIDGILIFTTAFDQYALQAIKVKAEDYLLKPIKISELSNLLEKLEQKIISINTIDSEPSSSKSMQNRFLVKYGKNLKIITLDEIAYFYADQKLTLIYTWSGRKYPLEVSLNKLEESLPSELFFRLNRKLISHLKAIEEMQVYSKSRIKIILKPNLEEEMLVSTDKASIFKKWLGGSKIIDQE